MMLTIFTPLYNREILVKRLYESLTSQTNQNFEWLVVDDGSTDNSYAVVNSILHNENKFTIRLYTQKNSGKHVAINTGIDKAEGNIFFIVDSDDYLPNDAVEKIYKYFEHIKNCEIVVGISAVKAYDTRSVVGTSFSDQAEFIDISNLERREHGITGDRAEVYYTSILKKYRFPVFENEKFISEATVWNKIAYDGYKLRFVNDILYFCEYLDAGLSKNIKKVFLNNWNGYTFYVNQEIKYRKHILNKFTILLAYIQLAKEKKITLKIIKRQLDNVPVLLLIVAFFLQLPYRLVIKFIHLKNNICMDKEER